MLNRNQERGRILIIKDKDKPGICVADALRPLAGAQDFDIVTASGKSKLRKMLETISFSAVVIDVGRETGNSLAALRILEGFPDIPIFVFNRFMLPGIEEKTSEYGHCHYFENDEHFDDFTALLLAAMNRKKPGMVQGISLSGFLQMMNSEKWSGRVTVISASGRGIIFLNDGRLVGAGCGELAGHAAWQAMSAWEEIIVETQASQDPLAIPDSLGLTGALALEKDLPRRLDPGNGHPGAAHIELLNISLPGRQIALNLKKLNLALSGIRDILSDWLIRTDIFLSENGRSLAGWNSHPLACSEFAAITRALKNSLQLSGFPALADYYLLNLDDDQFVFIVITDELQWGFQLKDSETLLGLLITIVLPKAIQALAESLAVQGTA